MSSMSLHKLQQRSSQAAQAVPAQSAPAQPRQVQPAQPAQPTRSAPARQVVQPAQPAQPAAPVSAPSAPAAVKPAPAALTAPADAPKVPAAAAPRPATSSKRSTVSIKDLPRELMSKVRAAVPGATSNTQALTVFLAVKLADATGLDAESKQLYDQAKADDGVLTLTDEMNRVSGRLALVERESKDIFFAVCALYYSYLAYPGATEVGRIPAEANLLFEDMPDFVTRLRSEAKRSREVTQRRLGRPEHK